MFTLHKTPLHLLRRSLSAIWYHRNTIALWLALTLRMIVGMFGAWVDLHLPE